MKRISGDVMKEMNVSAKLPENNLPKYAIFILLTMGGLLRRRDRLRVVKTTYKTGRVM